MINYFAGMNGRRFLSRHDKLLRLFYYLNQNAMTEENDVPLRAYTSKELAALYGVNLRTLYRWLKPYWQEIGPRIGYIFSILQVKIIFQSLGWPKIKKGGSRE